MKPTNHYRWIVPSSIPPGKMIRTKYLMSEAVARERYGDKATPIEATLQVISTPETEEERREAMYFGSASRPEPKSA